MSVVNSPFRVVQYVGLKALFAFLLLVVPAIALFYLMV